ncbi:protein of unknown function (plasmid) [Pararobbsia alpina]|uniref:hypothetical protein n=1 Tax=Pararobbsia alpina TaxID=621374 RepID=UPI0039A50FFD
MQVRSASTSRLTQLLNDQPNVQLWAVHFPEQNDWYAAPNEAAARDLAKVWNAFVVRTATLEPSEKVNVAATARVRPHGADSHAKCVREWSRVVWDFTPPTSVLS